MRLKILMFFNMFVEKSKEMILNGYEWLRLRILVMSWSWNSFELKCMTFFMWFYVTEPFKFFSMRWTVFKCPKNSQSDGKFWNFLGEKNDIGLDWNRVNVAHWSETYPVNIFVEHAVSNSLILFPLNSFIRKKWISEKSMGGLYIRTSLNNKLIQVYFGFGLTLNIVPTTSTYIHHA